MMTMSAYATTETKAARNAYSMMSCPSSSRTKRRPRFVIVISRKLERADRQSNLPVPSIDCLRRRGSRLIRHGIHSREDGLHIAADGDEKAPGHDRDERRQQRVLDNVLALFLTNETNDQTLHLSTPQKRTVNLTDTYVLVRTRPCGVGGGAIVRSGIPSVGTCSPAVVRSSCTALLLYMPRRLCARRGNR